MQNDINKPHKKNQIIKALQWFGVVAVSLLLVLYFLVVDTSGGQKTPVIGKVNGRPMYYSKDSIYGRTYQRLVNTYKQFGIGTDGEMGRFIAELAFKEAASAMILEEVAEKNISVSDNFVVEVLKNEFTDTNGIFMEEQYKAFISRTPASEKLKIQKDIKDSLLQNILSLELFGSIRPSSLDIKNSYMKSAVKRDIEMLYIDTTKIADTMEIDAIEINKYFNDNKTNFALADVSIIALSSETSANSLYEELSKKVKTDTNAFAKVASEKSEIPTPNNDGYLGEYTKQEFPSPILGDAVFEAKEANTLLKPILYNEKYYLMFVHYIKIPTSIEELKDGIVESEYKEKNKTTITDKIKADKEKILETITATANNFSQLNGRDNIEYYKSSAPFTFNASSIMGQAGTALPESSDIEFHKTVFSTPVGSVSKPIKLSDGIAVIKVLSDVRPTQQDYDNYLATTGVKRVKAMEIQNAEKLLRDSWAEIEYSNSKVIKNKGF